MTSAPRPLGISIARLPRIVRSDARRAVIKCETINGRSFRPKVQLLRKGAPPRLLLEDELRGCLRRVRAADCKAQCNEPLLDIGIAQELPDLPVQLRHDVSGRAGRSNHDQPAVQLEP